MRIKIRHTAIVLVILGLNIYSSVAQSPTYQGTIQINPIRLEQKGELLHVDIDISLNNVKVRSAQGVDIIPQIISTVHTQSLPKISIKGKDEYMVYERTLSLMSKKEKAAHTEPYTIKKGYKRGNETIQYRYTIPYESWMKDARLDARIDECGCGETALMKVEPVIDRVTLEYKEIPLYTVTPHTAYIRPVAEEVKHREVQAEAFLDFAVNKTDIRPDYMNNPRELNKIHKMIDDLKNDPDIRVNRLDIIGYASPEGTLEANKRLSEGRARAIRDYLATRYEFPRNLYHIVFGGENWDGLVKALETIEMDYKDEILDIIEKNTIEGGREKKLMNLRGGDPYRYLLKNTFPELRVAICKVNFNVKNFNISEAKEVIKKHPKNLSLNEMFLVANTYPEGSQEFIDVFETAVRLYPEDEVANLNAATSALTRKDLISAERYLSRVHAMKHLPEYNNTAGMIALLNGDYENAEKLLNAAATAGLEAARQNLEELAKKRANETEIKRTSK